jgi:hypothetical protein
MFAQRSIYLQKWGISRKLESSSSIARSNAAILSMAFLLGNIESLISQVILGREDIVACHHMESPWTMRNPCRCGYHNLWDVVTVSPHIPSLTRRSEPLTVVNGFSLGMDRDPWPWLRPALRATIDCGYMLVHQQPDHSLGLWEALDLVNKLIWVKQFFIPTPFWELVFKFCKVLPL